MKWSRAADRRVVEAVVKVFHEADDGFYALLLPLSVAQWERSYYWLDASGMALYLLRRLEHLGLLETIPLNVRDRLKQNLSDNLVRSASMFEEFTQLNRDFQEAGVDYCNLKGFSLSPISCPDPALRVQLDFDFLVNGMHLDTCRKILSRYGYVLRSTQPTVWEFKTDSIELASIANLYKPRPQRCVELHFVCSEGLPSIAKQDERLNRRHFAEINGLVFPVLSPVDQFIGQAVHIYSHLCGPSTRLAWLLEMKNHIQFRFNEDAFWDQVIDRIREKEQSDIALGVVCLALKELFCTKIPDALEIEVVGQLPASANLWTMHYAARSILADFPGSKLYLLLQDQSRSNGGTESRSRRKALMPLSRPPRILNLPPKASLWRRLASELYQIRYEAFRCRFHLVEGLAYLRELQRWRCILKRESTLPASSVALRSRAVQSQ